MYFNFISIRDAAGQRALRPVFRMRLEREPVGRGWYCMLDTGTPDNLIAWNLAAEAEVPLCEDDAELFMLEGIEVHGVSASCNFVIEDGMGSVIELNDMPVVFTQPWPYDDFGGVLGTTGMKNLLVTISARQKWIELNPVAKL